MSKNEYWEKLQDVRWQRLSAEIKDRDKWTCFDCGSTEKMLQVHHCKYFKGEPWETPGSHLMTVCGPCHKKRQALEREIVESFTAFFANTPIDRLRVMALRCRAVEDSDGDLRPRFIVVDKEGREVEVTETEATNGG